MEGNFQQLLQLLHGKPESWSEAGKSLGAITVLVGGYFTRIMTSLFDTADSSYDSFQEWKLKLGPEEQGRLLQTIGNCRTLRQINVKYEYDRELEALLTPMQSNPVLESLTISTYYRSAHVTDHDHLAGVYEILGRILQTSRTLKSLTLDLCGYTQAYHHLASGLRGNDEAALEKLSLHVRESWWASDTKQVAEMVLSAPRLSDLRLTGINRLEDIDALAKALAQSTSLKALLLKNMWKGASALLLKALTRDGSNRSITSLVLNGYLGSIGNCLPPLLSLNHSLKHLTWDQSHEDLSPEEWESLSESLRSNSSLELFRILVRRNSLHGVQTLLNAVDMNKTCVRLYMTLHSDQSINNWISAVERTDEEGDDVLREIMKKPILELHFPDDTYRGDSWWPHLAKTLRDKVHAFSSLHLVGPRMQGLRELENFRQALRDTSSLRLLTIEGDVRGWNGLVECLRVNTSITHLRLIRCVRLDDDVFKQFMGVLQVNLTLQSVRLTGTSWETDGKKALIEEALKRNAEQDSYFSIFRRHGLQFHPAKNGRLFLCGSPFAGKTMLRHTMTRFLRGTSLLGDKALELSRTEGIEVELLKNDQEMQIAIWDLAGQWIFRTLQDILFPRTNHTSIFLFMFSPYDRNKCCIKENLDRCFQSELEEWLRFIASNSQVTWQMLPKVLVVMSHMDKMKYHDVKWAQSTLTDLRKEYESIIDLRSEELYFLDARKKKDVTPLKHSILEIFRELLAEKTLLAPRVCLEISSKLAKRTKDVKDCPVWSSQEFYRFCFSTLPNDIKVSTSVETTSGLEVFQAIASYLHDKGSIIIIRSLDKIIVDPNWLTSTFLGELLTKGHNFQVKGRAVKEPDLVPFSSRTGFVSSGYLQFLLSSFLEKHPRFRKLDESFLEDLLVHFHLCYKLDDGSMDAQYYIPTIVPDDPSFTGIEESLAWSSPPARDQEFIGFRVQCDNPRRMSMTTALYPRFQIHLRRKLMTEMNLTEEVVICSRNRMHLIMDGHEIFVERSDMAKSHIDVM